MGPDRRVVLQVLIIATGFIVPAMFFLGVVFAIMWFYAIRVGRQGDAIKAARQAQSPPRSLIAGCWPDEGEFRNE